VWSRRSEDSQVYIWNRADATLLEVLPGHSGCVNAVAWSPVQHGVFASASDDHTVRIWGAKARGASAGHGRELTLSG
jgi:WD40 repeat protein